MEHLQQYGYDESSFGGGKGCLLLQQLQQPEGTTTAAVPAAGKENDVNVGGVPAADAAGSGEYGMGQRQHGEDEQGCEAERQANAGSSAPASPGGTALPQLLSAAALTPEQPGRQHGLSGADAPPLAVQPPEGAGVSTAFQTPRAPGLVGPPSPRSAKSTGLSAMSYSPGVRCVVPLLPGREGERELVQPILVGRVRGCLVPGQETDKTQPPSAPSGCS